MVLGARVMFQGADTFLSGRRPKQDDLHIKIFVIQSAVRVANRHISLFA